MAWTAFVPSYCAAQSEGWGLLADSMVMAPYGELRTAAAYRMYQDDRRREMAWRVARLSLLRAHQDTLATSMQMEVAALRDAMKATDMALDASERRAEGLEGEVRRRNARMWWQLPAAAICGILVGATLAR